MEWHCQGYSDNLIGDTAILLSALGASDDAPPVKGHGTEARVEVPGAVDDNVADAAPPLECHGTEARAEDPGSDDMWQTLLHHSKVMAL